MNNFKYFGRKNRKKFEKSEKICLFLVNYRSLNVAR